MNSELVLKLEPIMKLQDWQQMAYLWKVDTMVGMPRERIYLFYKKC